MIDEQTLQDAVRRIVEVAQPRRVIVFGSHGRGDAGADADLDIMVIKRQVQHRGKEILGLHEAVGRIGTDVDVLVYSEDEVRERQDWCTSPVYWALREGKTLYDAG